MATLSTAVDGLIKILRTSFVGFQIQSTPIIVDIADGWPPEEAIQKTAKKPAVVIGLFDRNATPDNSYFSSGRTTLVKLPIGIASALSLGSIAPGGSVMLMLSIADGQTGVLVNDAVSLIVDQVATRFGVVSTASEGTALEDLAQDLALQVNSLPVLNGLVSASANGAVVTIINNSVTALRLSSNTGNIGIAYKEVGRINVEMQIVCYAGTWLIRKMVSDVLEVALASLNAQYGFQADDGDWIKVQPARKFFTRNDSDTPADVYRRDFFVNLSYSITRQDVAYSVLVPIANQQLF